MINLQTFINTIPDKITRRRVARAIQYSRFPHKTEVALRAYAQHDALHYLFNQPFTSEGEECVAYLELLFNRGWLPFGEKYNRNFPRECECGTITVEQIDEIALKLYEAYDDYQE